MKKTLALIILALLMASCASKKEVLYFQDIDDTSLIPVKEIYQHPEIQSNDILKIDITALEQEAVLPFMFNKLNVGNQRSTNLQTMNLEGFVVGEDGTINFPELGKLKVVGKTTSELEDFLKEKLSQSIINPTVKVRLLNYKVTVMGEVKSPGTYTIAEESITLPQAIGLAGDMTINGKRKEVLIVRQKDGERQIKRIDFTKSDWMNSEFYFLQPNDMVYVQPNNPKVKTAGFIGSVGNLLSVASILLSAAVIIFR
ncbi:MAG: polysaccharide biosynthesis/export family protein [Mesonia hippocampi]|uniref:polysaccharide biosynthesis/export family protein n=1 Tax=Mesonia hippocampi TaxID=1628250 RepID=UPI003F9EACF3